MTDSGTFDHQFAFWAEDRKARLEMGDDLSVARPVDHFAYFRRKSQAEAAADALVDAGFEVGIGRQGLRTVVEATRSQSLGDDEVASFMTEVIGIVESAQGAYDGWGAPTS